MLRTNYVQWDSMIKCCGLFRPDEDKIWHLTDKDGFHKRIMEAGTCPHCLNWVVQLTQYRYFDNKRLIETYKKRRALKKYNEFRQEIDFKQENVHYGTKANMSFRYGENKEVRDKDNEIIKIKQISVDFNGVKRLEKTIKV